MNNSQIRTLVISGLLMLPAPAWAGNMMTCSDIAKMTSKMKMKACMTHKHLACCGSSSSVVGPSYPTAITQTGRTGIRTVRSKPRSIRERIK